MRGCVPAPTCGMRRLLSQHVHVVDVPEAYTTKTCSKCRIGEMKPCRKREDKRGRVRDVRGLRRCNNVDCAVIMDRDYNAAINIRKNLIHYLKHGEWDPI